MPAYYTPGVYVDEIPKFPPSVAQVATAIPAFIGYTQMAIDRKNQSLTNKPTRITSLLEYEGFFGKAAGEENIKIDFIQEQSDGQEPRESIAVSFSDARSRHVMYYALQTFFANGGGPCYIVSVGAFKEELGADLDLAEMDAGLKSLEKEDEPTLLVFPEGQFMKTADYYTLQNSALAQCELLKDRFCILDLTVDGNDLKTSGEVSTAADAFRSGITSGSLKYGAAYFPNIVTVFRYTYDEAKVSVTHTVNGANGAVNGKNLSEIKTTNTAAYNKLVSVLNDFGVTLPPSAAIAGVYATVDATRGVWKAPANVGLNAVKDLTFKVNNGIQDFLNVSSTTGKSINCLRAFTGKGILVWGARTLAGNDNEWRYVPVRRLFNMVEESCKNATGPFVFEPNDANTWVKVKAMIENFLTVLWREGALAGAKPEHAFYVACGLNQTMTADDILNGKLIVEVGLAAVRPAEFIVLRFSHKMQES